ncbi:MAG: hypothetical protein JWM47_3226 [Acidimicrobiales bacterium]|nr:hypothetical protein [Acidimicrobiales bacterium]
MMRDAPSAREIRRLGERRALPERIPGVVIVPAKGWRKRSPGEVPILIDNVSVSGIGFFVPGEATFEVEETIEIGIEDQTCSVQVRRVDHGATTGWTYYGVAFVGASDHVLPALERQVLNDDDAARLMRWSQGRGW